MRFYLSILALSVVFLADLGAQCIDGKLTDEVWATIGNDFRRNSAYTYGMTSYQLLEDNFYFNGQEDPLFYLGYSKACLLYTSPSPRDKRQSRMPSSA